MGLWKNVQLWIRIVLCLVGVARIFLLSLSETNIGQFVLCVIVVSCRSLLNANHFTKRSSSKHRVSRLLWHLTSRHFIIIADGHWWSRGCKNCEVTVVRQYRPPALLVTQSWQEASVWCHILIIMLSQWFCSGIRLGVNLLVNISLIVIITFSQWDWYSAMELIAIRRGVKTGPSLLGIQQ